MQDAPQNLSDSKLIQIIHSRPFLERVWKRCDTDLKRKVLYEAAGDPDFLSIVIEDAEETLKENGNGH